MSHRLRTMRGLKFLLHLAIFLSLCRIVCVRCVDWNKVYKVIIIRKRVASFAYDAWIEILLDSIADASMNCRIVCVRCVDWNRVRWNDLTLIVKSHRLRTMRGLKSEPASVPAGQSRTHRTQTMRGLKWSVGVIARIVAVVASFAYDAWIEMCPQRAKKPSKNCRIVCVRCVDWNELV